MLSLLQAYGAFCSKASGSRAGRNLVGRSSGSRRIGNVSQIVSLDKSVLTERVGKLPRAKLELILVGIDVILGR